MGDILFDGKLFCIVTQREKPKFRQNYSTVLVHTLVAYFRIKIHSSEHAKYNPNADEKRMHCLKPLLHFLKESGAISIR